MLKQLTVDFEGDVFTTSAADDTTHVVISHPQTGGLRVQATSDPLSALVRAQRNGDETPRMAAVASDQATFTVVPDYDAAASPAAAADRRSRRWEAGAFALVAVVVALLIVTL